MKSIIYKLSFILFLTIPLYSQVEIPFFDKIAGNWEGMYDSSGVTYKEAVQMKWLLNHNYFVITIMDGINQQYMKYSEKECLYFTRDNDNNLTGWNFDYIGFNNLMNFSGTIEDNKISVTGKNSLAECNITFELKDNQLIQQRETKTNDRGIVKQEIIYNNIRNEYKMYSLPTTYEKIGEKGLAYVCHISEKFVTVFDTKTNELIGKIPCGVNPNCICFSPDENRGCITNFTSNNVTIFDKKTNEIIATVDAGQNPTFLLPVNNNILISHQSGDGIYVLDAIKNSIIKKFTEGTGPLYLIDNENKIYQPQIFSPYLFIIDPVKLEITKRVQTGGRPMEMAFINDNQTGYMVNYDLDEVTKFETKTDNIINHIKNVYHPRGIASSPDGKLVYVTNVVDGKVYVISTETDAVTATIGGFKMPVSIAFTADGKFAYVLNQGAATISVIDSGSNEIIETIGTAGNPISILIDNG